MKDIAEEIEYKMAKGADKTHIIRLLILLSVSNGGLKESLYL